MATLEVVQRAAAAGTNMVITHEPTYYSHQDRVDGLAGDEIYEHKADFLRRNGMVVFHLHDHWHDRRPDGIAMGMPGNSVGKRTWIHRIPDCTRFRA